MHKVWRVAAVVTVALLLGVPAVWAQRGAMAEGSEVRAEPSLKPLAMFEVRDLDEFIEKFETELGALLPVYAPGALWKQITELSGSSTLPGIDRSSRLTFALYNPEAAGNVLGLVLTVSSIDTLLQGLETELKKGEVEGDLHIFYKEKSTFDFQAYQEATPEERKDVKKFQKTERQPLYVMVKGRLAMMSRSREIAVSLGGMQKSLERGLTVSDWVKDCDVLGSLDMPEIMRTLQPYIDQMVMMMGMAAMQGGQGPIGAGLGSPQAAMQMMTAQVEAFKSLAGSVEAVDLGLKLEEGGEIIFRKSVSVDPSGTLAGLVANQGMHKPTLLKYAPENSAMVGWMALDDWAPFMDFSLALMEKMSAAMGGEQDVLGQMMEQSKAMLGIMGREVMFSMYPGSGGGMGIFEVFQVKDPAKAAEMLAESMKLMSSFYANMGVGVKFVELEPEEYQGVKLQGFKMEFGGEGMPPEAAAMVEQMYGGAPAMYAGVKGDNMLVTFGADASSMIRRGIDAVAAGKSLGFDGARAYQTAVKKLPNEGEGVGLFVLSLSRMGDFIRSMGAPGVAGPGMMPPLPDGSVYMYVGKEGDRLQSELSVPVGDIVKGVMAGMMQMAIPAEGAAPAATE